MNAIVTTNLLVLSDLNQRIGLYFTEGGSDKEYQAQLQAQGDGFVVNAQFGRRGSALKGITKTVSPVPYDKALKIYKSLVAEKMGKGYTPLESGEIFQSTPQGSGHTGLGLQLLNAITREQADRLVEDANWFMQLKFDGERRALKVDADGAVTGMG